MSNTFKDADLECEISTLFARYTRVIANQKRRPQFEIIALIIVKCNVEIVTKGDENTMEVGWFCFC